MTGTSAPKLSLRAAAAGDARLLFDWLNEPAVREASFSTSPVPWEDHEHWYARKLASADCAIFIASDVDGTPAGVIRFEVDGHDAVVSLTVEPGHRGRGVAAELIRRGCERFQERGGLKRFVAEIKSHHAASRKAFANAGFVLAEAFEKGGAAAVRMTRPAPSGAKRS